MIKARMAVDLTEALNCTPQEIRAAQFPAELADADPIEERSTCAE
jgi:hypothetical protein